MTITRPWPFLLTNLFQDFVTPAFRVLPRGLVTPASRPFTRILATLILVSASSVAARPPNVVFILCDDLGYGDIGPFGQQKIRTPNLDRLAAGGMKFTRHYAGSPVCAPSRCVLMTGRHSGHAFIRDNREMGKWESGEGQLPIPDGEVTLAELFKQGGYATGAFGKWGLGGVGSPGDPLKQGFDHFFGYNDQRHAHNFYPQYLIEDAKPFPLDNPVVKFGKLAAGENPDDPANYARFAGRTYSADVIAERARQFVRANKDRPFFLYFPTTVPHLALQVPEDALAEYKDKLGDKPYPGGNGYAPHRWPRAAYAAMITRMDREVGSLVGLLRELGLEEDTIIAFTSDNGAVYPLSGTDPEFFQSNGGLAGYKGSVQEGGIRVPLIVAWKGHIPAGVTSERVTGFEDWLPTLLELAGARVRPPASADGVSFAPTLLGREQPPREFLYREFAGYGGQQMVRAGDWKAVREKLLPAGRKADPVIRTKLFNLAKDPHELTNVAAENPGIVAKLEKIMREQHVPSVDFPIPVLDGGASAR